MKISITIDLGKINKEKITLRTYTNKDGQQVTVKEYKMDVVPVKEEKIIKEGATWKMVKSHFVVESPTKEEREAKTKTPILGDGIQFRETDTSEADINQDINPQDIPF